MTRVDHGVAPFAIVILVHRRNGRIIVLKAYLFLVGAIVAEVSASSFVNESEYLTKLKPSLITCAFYLLALVLFSQSLRSIPLGLG